MTEIQILQEILDNILVIKDISYTISCLAAAILGATFALMLCVLGDFWRR